MRKQYFVLLLIGLIAVAGVIFTACNLETTVFFENYTAYKIRVQSQDLTPGILDIPGLEHEIDDPVPVSATSKNGNPKFTYSRVGDSSGSLTDSTVKLKIDGSVYQFWPKADFDDPSIKIPK